jgi:rubrerythrin
MADDNSIDEILEFAIGRELEACEFYKALAGRVDDPNMSKVFEDFAEEELEHKAKLELELMKIGRTTLIRQAPGVPTRSHIVSDTDSLLDMDYKDILLLGIEKEEASFRTYINLLANITDEESREVLMALAEEEVKHKLRFEAEYDLLLRKA